MSTSTAAFSLEEPERLATFFSSERRLIAWVGLLGAAVIVVTAGLGISFYRYAQAAPLQCEEGAELKGDVPPRALEQWCEKGGVRDGAYRRWHPTATRLTQGRVVPVPIVVGEYLGGERSGLWTESSVNGYSVVESLYSAGVLLGQTRYVAGEPLSPAEPGPTVSINVMSIEPAR